MIVTLAPKARKYLRELHEPDKGRIIAGLRGLEKSPSQGDIKQLKGTSGTYRLRVGDWRILFSRLEDDIILVEKIGPRGQVYGRV